MRGNRCRRASFQIQPQHAAVSDAEHAGGRRLRWVPHVAVEQQCFSRMAVFACCRSLDLTSRGPHVMAERQCFSRMVSFPRAWHLDVMTTSMACVGVKRRRRDSRLRPSSTRPGVGVKRQRRVGVIRRRRDSRLPTSPARRCGVRGAAALRRASQRSGDATHAPQSPLRGVAVPGVIYPCRHECPTSLGSRSFASRRKKC